VIYGSLSLTFLANLVLFDRSLLGPLTRLLGPLDVGALSVAAAFINTVAACVLAWMFHKATRA
jgi:hypothetical protein